MKKLLYEQPKAEVFEIRLRNHVLIGGSPDGSWDNSIKGGTTWGSAEGDDPYGME